jgi:3,4-dihydroxy-2-butanone 4-phosphate synthase
MFTAIGGEQLSRRAPTGFVLVIEIRETLTVGVADDKGRADVTRAVSRQSSRPAALCSRGHFFALRLSFCRQFAQ